MHRLQPRFNRRGARPQSSAYVHLTVDESFPRLRVVRRPGRTGVHLGPVATAASAARIVEALHQVLPLRRCSAPLRRGEPTRDTPCLPAQLGVAACPCAGDVDPGLYDAAVRAAAAVLGGRPGLVVPALEQRVVLLAAQRRFEEAALVRDRLSALTAALDRTTRVAGLVAMGEHILALPGGVEVVVDRGRVMGLPGVTGPADVPGPGRPASPAFADEAMVISRWLTRAARRGQQGSQDAASAAAR